MESSAPESRAGHLAVIEQSIDAALRLRQILLDERQALERQDNEALSAATDGKRACVAKLEALENERRALERRALERRALARDESADPDGRIAEDWQRFLQIAGSCRDLNTTNGAILHLRRRQFAAALRIVGGAQPDTVETYGPTGGERLLRPARSLAEI